jgi:hypothetical protein
VPLEERFWRHVERTESCWLWTGVHAASGAGVLPVRHDGEVQLVTAARVAWELFVGPIPSDRRLWRRCRRPACVRPDHLMPVRYSRSNTEVPSAPTSAMRLRTAGRGDARRTWWTRDRVLTGLVAFHAATGLAPTTSRGWCDLIQRTVGGTRRFPTVYAVMRHFANFRAAWNAARVQLADENWAPWTPEQDRFLLDRLGVQPTIVIAAALRRGEAAVRTRARKLGVHVADAQGWPLQRVARVTGLSEYLLRAYIRRGQLPAFKGAKFIYLDPGDLTVVAELLWQQVPVELEAAARRSLRQRLVTLLTSRTGCAGSGVAVAQSLLLMVR